MVAWESVTKFGKTLPDVEESTILVHLDQYLDVDAELEELITEARRIVEAKTHGKAQ